MSAEKNPSDELSAEAAQPKAGQAPVPVWLIVLLFFSLYCGTVYFDVNGAGFSGQVYAPYRSVQEVEGMQPSTGPASLVQLGLQVYNKPTCLACHQASGKGVPGQFPPLVRSDWVLEPEPGRIIRAVLDGLSGPMQVEGQSFNGTMVPWKNTLTDEEIAAVLTYVRQNDEWGNKVSEVSPERVKQVRERTKGRNQSYSPEELLKISPAD